MRFFISPDEFSNVQYWHVSMDNASHHADFLLSRLAEEARWETAKPLAKSAANSKAVKEKYHLQQCREGPFAHVSAVRHLCG